MKDAKVLGLGCRRCNAAVHMVRDAATKAGVEVTVEKVTDGSEISGRGIASTLGLVADGKVMHAGGLPMAEDVARWIRA